MTHLSPFSYPSRFWIIAVAFTVVYLLNRYLFRYSWRRALLKDRTMKFWAMTFLYTMLITWMIYDLITWINTYYVVGSDIKPPDAPSYVIYSTSVKNGLKRFSDGLLDVTFISHSTCIFLMLSFWHSIFNFSSFERVNFWNRWEFKFYLFYALLALVAYPSAQWPLMDNAILFVVVPQMLYCFELIFSSILILIVRYRINRVRSQLLTTYHLSVLQ